MSGLTKINNPTTISPNGSDASLNITHGQAVIDSALTEIKVNGTTALSVGENITLMAAPDQNINIQTSGTGRVIVPGIVTEGMSSSVVPLRHAGIAHSTDIAMNMGSVSMIVMLAAQGNGNNGSNAVGQYSIVKRHDQNMIVNTISEVPGAAGDVYGFDIDNNGNFQISLTDSGNSYTEGFAQVKFSYFTA